MDFQSPAVGLQPWYSLLGFAAAGAQASARRRAVPGSEALVARLWTYGVLAACDRLREAQACGDAEACDALWRGRA